MASEEDVRVAEFLAGRYAVGPAQRQAAAEIATALTAARAETWKEAIAVVSQYGAARVHAFGDKSIPSIMDSLEAAAGSNEAEDRKAAVIRRGKE